MLILARRVNESIIIGEEIRVSVVDIRGDQVKLGIDAPRSVKVYRQEVFDAIGHRLLVNVEIKVEAGYHPIAQEEEVVRLIEDNQMIDRVIVSSFSPRSLRRVHKLDPNTRLGLLYGRPEPAVLPLVLRWLGVRYDALHPSFQMVDARYIERARRWGVQVNVWTVNAAGDMVRMRDLGVDSIITNYPDVLRDVLAKA